MKRIQFLMDDDLVRELDGLVEKTGMKTRTQLLNVALTLYEWAIRERESGNIIASLNEKTERYKEIELPGFPAPASSLEEASLSELAKELLNRLNNRHEAPENIEASELLNKISELSEEEQGQRYQFARAQHGKVFVTPSTKR